MELGLQEWSCLAALVGIGFYLLGFALVSSLHCLGGGVGGFSGRGCFCSKTHSKKEGGFIFIISLIS